MDIGESLPVRQTVKSVADDTANLSQYQRTDLGNAERLIRDFGDDLRFSPKFNRWLVWDGRRWARDEAGLVTSLAISTVRGLYEEAKAVSSEEKRKKFLSFALKSQTEGRIRAVVSLARHLEGVVVAEDQLDAEPMDLNTVTDSLPYTWYHFNEFATGRVANCFGEEFGVYDDRTPPRTKHIRYSEL